MDSSNPNQLLTVAEICREYRIRKTNLYEILASGKLTAKKIGKRGTRIRREDVNRYVESLPNYKPQTIFTRPKRQS